MKYQQALSLNDLINILKSQHKNIDFSIYDKGSPGAANLDSTCIIGEPSTITEDDEEIYPEYITNFRLEFWYSDELLEDVVMTALNQKNNASNEEIHSAIRHYSEHDDFLDLI